MSQYSVRAEWEPLSAVRVHTPGVELWSGSLAPEANLFEAHVPPDQARREHEALVEVLAESHVEVHRLADDLAGDALDDLTRSVLAEGGVDRIDDVLASFDAREKLAVVLSRPRLAAETAAGGTDGASVTLEAPISNIYFQRDTTIVGDKGPILCHMSEPIRQREVPIVRRAWEAIGATFSHEMTGEPLEGGEFMPAGEFALLGVSAEVDGEEHVIRTSYEAGERLMRHGAVSYDEFGLVRAPLEADRRLRQDRGLGSRVMHLLGWFNIAAEGLAVLDADLAETAAVDVYRLRGGSYEHSHTTSVLEYVRDERGFDVIDVADGERWPTNFLAIDDGVVIPLYEPDADGGYQPANNPTIEALRDHGVAVRPDGIGIPRATLTNGAGGLHCMTTPISRG